MFDKLRKHIMLLNLGVTSLVIIIAFTAIYLITAGSLEQETHRKLGEMGRAGFSGYAREDTLSSAYDLSFMLSVDGEGRIVDAYSRCGYPDEAGFEEAAAFVWNTQSADDFQYFNSYWRYYIYEDENGLYCIPFLEVTNDRMTLNTLLLALFLVGAAALAAILAFSAYFAKRVIRPIAEAWERQKRFVADASHELKTPLMTILANYDVLEANADETIKSQRVWMEPIKLGADRMGSLVADLLTLARAEGTGVHEEKRLFNLNDLIAEVILSMEAMAAAKNLSVNAANPPEGGLFNYEDSIRQVFVILYENAVKYSNEGGTIDVHVIRQKKQAILTVRNTGEGIAAIDLPRIFDRFYRADTARSAGSDSYGLGLSIARVVAERIGGHITARSSPGEWAEFSFRFWVA